MRAAILLGLMLSAATHAADSLQEAMAELQPSSLAVAAQRAELAWFADQQERNRRARPVLRHYRWRTLPGQVRGSDRFRDELLGRIAAAASLDPRLGARLRAEYDRIDWSAPDRD